MVCFAPPDATATPAIGTTSPWPDGPTWRSSAHFVTAAGTRSLSGPLILHEDAGLRRDPATYPDLTKVRQEPASDVWRVDERHVLGVAAVGRGAVVERAADHEVKRRANSVAIRISISDS